MSQDANGGVMPNVPGATFRADVNTALAAIVTNNSGASAPAITYAYMLWADTTTGLLKQRDSTNATWIVIGTMGAAYLGLLSLAGGNMTGGINFARTTVVSATTPDIWTSTGNNINYTGTNTATGFAAAPQAGASRILDCAAAAVFTAGANMLIDGIASGANLTVSAGDRVEVFARSTTQFVLRHMRVDGGLDAGDSRYGSAMLPFTVAQASNLLTATLTAPFKMDFRNVTLATGTPVQYAGASNLTLAMTSTAGSLGAVTAVAARLVWALVYGAGTPQIAVANIAGGLQMDETNLITTSAIGAGSTSNATWYSTSAIGTPSPYRIIGFCDATWTSGTGWGSPTTVQPAGVGQALAAVGSVGYGQTVQAVTGSRALGTTYYNTTGKPIVAMISVGTLSSASFSVSVNGVVVLNGIGATSATSLIPATVVVPMGGSYSAQATAGGPALNAWTELR